MTKPPTPQKFYHRWLPKRLRRDTPVVHLIRLSGVIGDGSRLQAGLSLHKLDAVLQKAFDSKSIKGVAIAINSPGGSPVQSKLIHDRIRQLAKKHELPVWTFCEDVAASGGYWLATAGDEIYASESSIIGSIGVVGSMFGFVGTLEKIGAERRVYTAGANKVQLDPFLPEKKADIDRLKKLQTEIHESFIDQVRKRRGEKLDESNKDLFSGAYWTGSVAQSLGLIDAIGELHKVLEEKFGDKVKIKQISPKQGLSLGRLIGRSDDGSIATGLTAGLTQDVLSTLEARSLWQRFGL